MTALFPTQNISRIEQRQIFAKSLNFLEKVRQTQVILAQQLNGYLAMKILNQKTKILKIDLILYFMTIKFNEHPLSEGDEMCTFAD